jgi:putative phage-type endonuclease
MTPTPEPLEQRTPEWHAARRGRITASMVGAILGHSPWQTREDAMRTLVRAWHNAPSEFTGNVATKYGEHYEEHALADYVMQTGNAVTSEGFVTREHWAGASPDGLIGLVGGIEIKCPYKFRYSKPEDMPAAEFLPLAEQPHYYDQVQFSLWVCERAWWDFWQWAPYLEPELERITPDSKWRTKNLPKLKDFYEEFLFERDLPEAQKYLDPQRVVIDTPLALQRLAEYDDLIEAIERAEERKKELLAFFVEMAKDRNAVIGGRNLTKVERAGAVSYAKVVKEHLPTLDLEPYRGKPSEYWQLK